MTHNESVYLDITVNHSEGNRSKRKVKSIRLDTQNSCSGVEKSIFYIKTDSHKLDLINNATKQVVENRDSFSSHKKTTKFQKYNSLFGNLKGMMPSDLKLSKIQRENKKRALSGSKNTMNLRFDPIEKSSKKITKKEEKQVDSIIRTLNVGKNCNSAFFTKRPSTMFDKKILKEKGEST